MLADIANFSEAMERHASIWQQTGGERSFTEWVDALKLLCHDFFGTEQAACPDGLSSMAWAQCNQQQQNLFTAFAGYAGDKLLDQHALSSDGFQRLLLPFCEKMDQEFSGGGSGISVANLVDWAGTPGKMIAVLGLNADSFPRSEERPNWHPLSGTRQWGDPDRREDDRHALLLALLASEERLVITYLGGSDHDAKERPPATTSPNYSKPVRT